MSDTKFFRKYLDILNEGPPPGVGPNAPARPATQQPVQPNTEPTQYQQAKDAVGQQVQNYKDMSGQIDQAVKQGQLDQKTASAAKSDLAGTMMRGGYEAGKAAMQGRDPSTAYVGSMVRSIGNTVANSGLDASMKKASADVSKYRGPNAQDIRNDPAFKKASPEQQAQALKDFDAIRNLSDEEYNYYTGGKAFKELGGQAAKAGQDMIDQKDWGKGPSSGYSPETNKLFGLDPTRQATDAEMKAAATGQQPQAPAAPTQQPQPQGTPQQAQQPTTEERDDDMDNRQLMRKYMDFLDEAPKTAQAAAAQADIARQDAEADAESDRLAADFNKRQATVNKSPGANQNSISGATNTATTNTSASTNTGVAFNQGGTRGASAPAANPGTPAAGVAFNQGGTRGASAPAANPGTPAAGVAFNQGGTRGASAQAAPANKFANITQQVAKASNVVDPNAPKGGGYDTSKVQYAYSGGKPTQAAPAGSATQSAALDASKANAIGGNKQATAPTFTGMAGSQTATNTQAAAPQSSLASQYVSANQPQTATAATSQPTSDVLATQALNSQDQGTSGQSKGVQAAFGQVAEEEGDNDDKLLARMIDLIRK